MAARAKTTNNRQRRTGARPGLHEKRPLEIAGVGDDALRVGDQHWTVHLTDGSRLSVRCERIEVDPTGNLLVYGLVHDEDGRPKLAPLLGLATGEWRAFHGTEALLDVGAVCVAYQMTP